MYNEVIPSYASLNESYLYLIENAEVSYNAMMADIGVQEYTEAVQGKVVSEADEGFGAKVKNLANKLVEWLKARWKNIKDLFDKAMEKINTKFDEIKRKIGDRRLNKIPAKISNLKDKNYGKTYEYPHLDEVSSDGGAIFNAVKAYGENVSAQLGSKGDPEEVKKRLKEIDDSFKREFGAGTDGKDSAIKGAIQSWVRGNEVTINKDYLSRHINDMINGVANFSKTQRTLKGALKGAQKGFDASIKKIKEEAKDDENFSKMFGVVSPYIKKVHHYTATASSVILTELRNKMMKEWGIIMRLSTISGIVDTKHESYYGDYSESQTYQSEMASLFSFDI